MSLGFPNGLGEGVREQNVEPASEQEEFDLLVELQFLFLVLLKQLFECLEYRYDDCCEDVFLLLLVLQLVDYTLSQLDQVLPGDLLHLIAGL